MNIKKARKIVPVFYLKDKLGKLGYMQLRKVVLTPKFDYKRVSDICNSDIYASEFTALEDLHISEFYCMLIFGLNN